MPQDRPEDSKSPAIRLLMNPAARRDAPWTPAQNAILNDAALAQAQAAIASWPGYAPTPLVALPGLAAQIGIAELWYKDEDHRFGLHSFKALGGAYAVARLLAQQIGARLGRAVSLDEITARAHPELARQITVCCATDGNHGRSVAWGAQSFGCGCVIFIHSTVSEGRRAAIAARGAEVRRTAGTYDDSVRIADETATQEGWFVVSDTSWPGYRDVPCDVMQGYEIMAAEVFDRLSGPPTHLFLQTGVGGMAAAVAALAVRRWGADRPLIVLCDPENAACWMDSLRAGQPVPVGGDLETLMAGLACGEVSALAWDILHSHADAVMTLPDTAAVAMMRRLADPVAGDLPLVAGESAVAGLAGLVSAQADAGARSALDLGPGARVVVFGTEGDTDPELYQHLTGVTGAAVRACAAVHLA